MSIEIRQLMIKSQVVQRQADERNPDAPAAEAVTDDTDWRAECRRLIAEMLDERAHR
jgi:hypothetical protein